MYDILCEAILVVGIQSTPVLTWLTSDGERLMSDDEISVGPQLATLLPLEFSILRAFHSGRYICEVTLYSLALQTPLIASASINLDVRGWLLNKRMSQINPHFSLLPQLMISMWPLLVHLMVQILMLQNPYLSPVKLLEELVYTHICGHQRAWGAAS